MSGLGPLVTLQRDAQYPSCCMENKNSVNLKSIFVNKRVKHVDVKVNLLKISIQLTKLKSAEIFVTGRDPQCRATLLMAHSSETKFFDQVELYSRPFLG